MASRPDRKVKNAKKEAMAELAAARDRKEAGGLSALQDFDVSTMCEYESHAVTYADLFLLLSIFLPLLILFDHRAL